MVVVMDEESILTSVKEYLGITADYTHFDKQIASDINTCFAILNQIGAGPISGFAITFSEGTSHETWRDYSDDENVIGFSKEYIEKMVRIMFDPPSSSFVLDSMKKIADEVLWRLNVYVDPTRLHE